MNALLTFNVFYKFEDPSETDKNETYQCVPRPVERRVVAAQHAGM